MKRILLLTLFVVLLSTVYAQGFGYDDKIDIGNGLYKVRSGDYYGIIKDDNVIVSMEYQDIRFKDGKALLTKDDVLYGLVDSLGNVRKYSGSYKIHPYYRYVYDGFILVSLSETHIVAYQDKWGYIDEYERPLRIKKLKGAIPVLNNNMPTLFDEVGPFVEGCAAVYLKKRGWMHIDKYGREHYVLDGDNTMALFRSSVYNKECVVVTSDGIKLYQENNDFIAGVKLIMSTSATSDTTKCNKDFEKVEYREGILYLDSLMRVYKYGNEKDSIVFIEQKKNVPLEDMLNVQLVYKNIQAREDGNAYTEIKLKNISENKIEKVNLTVESKGKKIKEWSGVLEAESDSNTILLAIPAKFSESTIKRDIIVKVECGDESFHDTLSVTIKRYIPNRSR